MIKRKHLKKQIKDSQTEQCKSSQLEVLLTPYFTISVFRRFLRYNGGGGHRIFFVIPACFKIMI